MTLRILLLVSVVVFCLVSTSLAAAAAALLVREELRARGRWRTLEDAYARRRLLATFIAGERLRQFARQREERFSRYREVWGEGAAGAVRAMRPAGAWLN